MYDYMRLKVWQKAHALTIDVYRLSRSFPGEERFGLTSQIRRAAVSIGSNLAEGNARRSRRERVRYFEIAYGSESETEYQLILARDLGFANADNLHERLQQVDEIKRMLAALIRRKSTTTAN